MHTMSYRFVVGLFILAVAFSAPAVFAQADDDARTPGAVTLTDEALRLHRASLVIDGHNDLPWSIRKYADSSFDKMDITQRQDKLQTDIPRLRQGGLGAQFWAAYVPSKTPEGVSATRMVLEQIDLIYRMVERYPDTFEMAFTADDVRRIHGKGRIASLIGIEGGCTIENSLGALRMFHALGARYMTLTHGDTIDWCDSATDVQPHGGLTAFGEDVVREMNRLGMLVDISHISADAMRDVLRVTKAPIIASHSGASGVAEHARNVPDDVLSQLRTNGGVIMVNFFSGYVDPEGARIMRDIFGVERELHAKYPAEDDYRAALKAWKDEHPIPRGTVYSVVDHIDHIVRIAGIDHVGLGGDYDGVNTLPEQMNDVTSYPYITQVLLERGYTEADIRKIHGENILRALSEAQRVARRLAEPRTP